LLHEHNLLLNEQIYAPLLFIYQVLTQFKKWIIVDFKHAEYERSKTYTYNFYDIFDQNDELISKYSKTKFWSANIDLIEYLMIIYVIYVFVIRIFRTYSEKSVKQNALLRAKSWLDSNIPDWRKNKILINYKNRRPDLGLVFTKIKFKTNYVNKLIRKYKF
jgi:hypothetical protein